MSNQQAIDKITSTQWAIADLTSMGFGVGSWGAGWSTYDLYNRSTHRAHTLHIGSGGWSIGTPIKGTVSMNFDVDYNYFTTKRPVAFDNFDGRSADISGVNAVFYSATHLSIIDTQWDNPADGSPWSGFKLADEWFTSWGLGLPSVDLITTGRTVLEYGASGLPRGTPEMQAPNIQFPVTPENLDMRIRITQQDDAIVVRIPNIAMFDFDKHAITSQGEKMLTQVAEIIRRSPKLRGVEVEGHTDSTGSPAYNLDLSQKRAVAVVQCLKRLTFMWKHAQFKPPVGKGLSRPIAPNDNEVGRQLNRRVEIYLWYR